MAATRPVRAAAAASKEPGGMSLYSIERELEGKLISIQWVFDDNDELVPATELNVGAYGDDDAVWYDAEVVKVMKRLVEVFYPADDATRRHNLLVSGITDKSPEPFENYMAKGVRWKVKD